MGFVYALVDPRTGEPRYVGVTAGSLVRRLSQHWRGRNNTETHKTHWLRQLAQKQVRPEIVTLACVAERDLETFEFFWIAEMRRRGFALTNSTDGGNISLSKPEAVRRKIGLANKGRRASLQTREKMANAKRGVPKSPEHRAKLAENLAKARAAQVGVSRYGRRHSAETKRKIGAATTARALARKAKIEYSEGKSTE